MVLRKFKSVKSGIKAVTKPAIVVDLPAPLPPESVVTNSSKSKVRAKKPFQLIKVKERNLPRGISCGETASGAIFSAFCKSVTCSSNNSFISVMFYSLYSSAPSTKSSSFSTACSVIPDSALGTVASPSRIRRSCASR